MRTRITNRLIVFVLSVSLLTPTFSLLLPTPLAHAATSECAAQKDSSGKNYTGQDLAACQAGYISPDDAKACDAYSGSGNSSLDPTGIGGIVTGSYVGSCKVGQSLGKVAATTLLFADVQTAACANEPPGTQASCQSQFNSKLQSCTQSSNGDLKATKSCVSSAYPNLASQIDAITAPAAAGKTPTDCGSIIKGIGWFLCPVLDAMAGVADGVWGALQKLLQADPLIASDAGGVASSYFKVWQILLSIANVLLVIGFLFLIYSQLTSTGMSNYEIKKMLPKLLLVAILINTSFYIVAIIVDVFNVIGASLYAIFKGVYTAVGGAEIGWTQLIGLIIAGAAGGGAVATGAILILGGSEVVLLFLIPAVFAAVIGVLVALITLMFRQAIIPILAILSPIAFACLILPNMEQWFTRWRKAFTVMLLLYPIAAVLFGGLQLAGKVIATAPGGSAFAAVTGLIVMMMPLFLLPFIAAKAEGFLGQMNAKLTGSANRLGGAVKDWSNERADHARARYDSADIRTNSKGKPILRDRLRNTRRNAIRRKNERKLQTGAYQAEQNATFTKHVMENRDAMTKGQGEVGTGYINDVADRWREEEVKRQKSDLGSRSNESMLKDLAAGKGSDEYQAALAGTIMSRSHAESHLQAIDIMGKRNAAAEASGDQKAMSTVSSVQKQMAGDMKSKPFALGDQAAGQLVNGTYGRGTDNSGVKQPQFGDIQKELRDRVEKKLSAGALPTLNPDEMTRIMKATDEPLNSADGFTTDQASNLVRAIQDARANPQIYDLVKPEARAQHDKILVKYGNLAPAPAPPAAVTVQVQNSAPPQGGPHLRGGEQTTSSGFVVPRNMK